MASISYDRVRPDIGDRVRPDVVVDRAPENRIVNARQAAHLANASGVAADQLAGRSIADVADDLRHRLEHDVLGMREVHGRVVKVHPVTGETEGVPNATVHVEDTDCSFLGFHPEEGPFLDYFWLWELLSKREVIATTRTDACGYFRVWLAGWEVDRVRSWRQARQCFSDLFKPSLGDVILRAGPGDIATNVTVAGHEPGPPVMPDRNVLRQIGQMVGRPSVERLADLGDRRAFGAPANGLRTLLDAPAFTSPLPPPLTDDALGRLERASVSVERVVDLSAAKAVGPFLRCSDVTVEEWKDITDVPDITFRVTQDVDGDGDEETIYSESLGDVRWNSNPLPPVTLHAESFARSTAVCESPVVPCTNRPKIANAGMMRLADPYHDNATGYARRVNRPHPKVPPADGGVVAQTPYNGVLELFGCTNIAGAAFYRVLDTDASGKESAIVGMHWQLATDSGPDPTHDVVSDGQGWYPVLTAAQRANVQNGEDLVLEWKTGALDGRHELRIELADAGKVTLKGVTAFSEPVVLMIDNHAPRVEMSQVRWRHAGADELWQTFTPPYVCMTIERRASADIELEITWGASARHLRSASCSTGGCGRGAPVPPANPDLVGHWHETITDNSVSRTALYKLAGSSSQGAYSFTVNVCGRAFNPSRHRDGATDLVDWFMDVGDAAASIGVSIAIVDA